MITPSTRRESFDGRTDVTANTICVALCLSILSWPRSGDTFGFMRNQLCRLYEETSKFFPAICASAAVDREVLLAPAWPSRTHSTLPQCQSHYTTPPRKRHYVEQMRTIAKWGHLMAGDTKSAFRIHAQPQLISTKALNLPCCKTKTLHPVSKGNSFLPPSLLGGR
ncbi:uncharacterized protein LY89DRAFT_224929 [Mollisia scopiformis]|uniref:Uncharacterized protein n=1 Tax=Mollisia scopiformis TaxID=149040 RepID=A0A194WXA5_MOLSC|nr:uncharacterized protein LY89DRAFT_224929 [Mollisia scopiformis]KUJ12222.1 hypothetical protein LY89DRAFT_224929 [Mollisia scopiformis]